VGHRSIVVVVSSLSNSEVCAVNHLAEASVSRCRRRPDRQGQRNASTVRTNQ
jgi:hypothetical protein